MIRTPLFRAALPTAVCAAMAVPVAAGSLLLMVVPAGASTVVRTATIAGPGATASGVLRSGGLSTPFTVVLPANAACPADTAKHGYHVYSYLVPRGADLSAVRFVNFPSSGYGLVNADHTYYGAVNTALHTGQIIGIPNNFEWGPLVKSDGGTVPLSKLVGGANHGVWEAGIACANTHGTLTDEWNTQVAFTAPAGKARGLTWKAVPGAPAGSFSLPESATPPPAAHAARVAPSTAPAAVPAVVGATRSAGGGQPTASGGTAATPGGSVAPNGTVDPPTATHVPVAALLSAGALALIVVLLLFLRRSWRAGPTTRGSVR